MTIGRSARQRSRRRDRDASDDPVPISDALAVISARLGAGPAGLVGTVFSRWEQIVGASVAEHVRPLRIDDDKIVVGVDHPAWVTQMRHLESHLLERLREVCAGHASPTRLEVHVLP